MDVALRLFQRNGQSYRSVTATLYANRVEKGWVIRASDRSNAEWSRDLSLLTIKLMLEFYIQNVPFRLPIVETQGG